MFKRVVNLPFKVLGKAARAVQQREDATMRARYDEAVTSDRDAELKHVPKFDVPEDYESTDLRRSTSQLLDRMEHAPPTFVDVRQGTRTEQIPETQHIPLNTLDIRLAELPPAGTTTVIYCQDEEQSLLATRFLRFRGIDEAYLLEGGLDAWKAAGGPLEPGS